MSLRIEPARWFELLVPRPQLPQALAALAQAGEVELEARSQADWPAIEVDTLREPLDQARALRKRFADVLPAARGAAASADDASAEARIATAISRLRNWRAAAEPLVASLEQRSAERRDLGLIAEFLRRLGDGEGIEFGRLARPGPHLACALLLETGALLPQEFKPLLVSQVSAERGAYVLLLGPRAAIKAIGDSVAGREARLLGLPVWLDGTAPQALAKVLDRIGAIDGEIATVRRSIEALSAGHGVAGALGELDALQWLADHLAVLGASEHLVRVTGWTLAETPQALLLPLHALGIAAVAGFASPPSGYRPPTRIRNPRWARAFELFIRLAGTPGGGEADPSMLVAVIAPLMFGYMFGDVGQGAVLVAAALLGRRRWPATAMLIPGGALAIAFGVAFGSVFAATGIVAPVWSDPLDAPLPVLLVPLLFGATLIVLGQLLDALSRTWSGQAREWLESDAGLLVAYLGAWIVLLDTRIGAACAAAGALWFVAGAAPRVGWRKLPARFGLLLERTLQLAVNTLSFIRVGAFALAHAGLGLAVSALAAAFASRPLQIFVFVIGNVLILALEGLVVGIQTTRLLLFEFFIRFVRGEGRPFRPLPPPLSQGGNQ